MDRYGQPPIDPRNQIAMSMMQTPPQAGGMPPPQAGAFGAPTPVPAQTPLQPPQLGGAQPTPPGSPMQQPQPPLGGIGNMGGPTPSPSFFGNNSSFGGFKPQPMPGQPQQSPFGMY